MKIKPTIKAVLWMMPGAAIMLLLCLMVSFVQNKNNPTEQIAFKARRIDLVSRMQLNLASSSEAEKSAVLAITDQDSKIFADQARAAAVEVERERLALAELLKTGGADDEVNLLDQFSQFFTEFQRIDDELLTLAVKNTNLKANSLAFGPAADALKEMNASLSRIVTANTKSINANEIMLLAFTAQTSVLRIQTLIAPHIMEESDEKMDKLEVLMAKEDEQVRHALVDLKALDKLIGDADLSKAESSYAEFTKLKTEILSLSRANTNVRSLSISLNQKRRILLLCQGVLIALQQAIFDEPVRGVTYGFPERPRSLIP